MAQYKILADSITGKGKQTFAKDSEVDGDRFVDAAHIPEMVKAGFIEVVKAPVPEKKTTKPDPTQQ